MRSILLNHSVSAAKIPIPSLSQSSEQILPAVSKTTRWQRCPGKDSFSYDVFLWEVSVGPKMHILQISWTPAWCWGLRHRTSLAKFDGRGQAMNVFSPSAGPHPIPSGDWLLASRWLARRNVGCSAYNCTVYSARGDQQRPSDLIGSMAKRLLYNERYKLFRIAESSSFASIFGQETMGSC